MKLRILKIIYDILIISKLKMDIELINKIIKFCDENNIKYEKDENEEYFICGKDIGQILNLKSKLMYIYGTLKT